MAKPQYRSAHQKERDMLRPAVERGEAWCTQPICIEPNRWIEPGTPWDLAHDRENGGYFGPAHARCNRSDGHAASCRSPKHDHGNDRSGHVQKSDPGVQLEMRVCVVCRALFQPMIRSSVACSDECRKRRKRQKNQIWQAERPGYHAAYQREWKRRRGVNLDL